MFPRSITPPNDVRYEGWQTARGCRGRSNPGTSVRKTNWTSADILVQESEPTGPRLHAGLNLLHLDRHTGPGVRADWSRYNPMCFQTVIPDWTSWTTWTTWKLDSQLLECGQR